MSRFQLAKGESSDIVHVDFNMEVDVFLNIKATSRSDLLNKVT